MLLLVPLLMWGYTYDLPLLKIQARLAPRLLMMSAGSSLPSEGEMTICLVHEEGDGAIPRFFREQLLQDYPEGLRGRKLKVLAAGYRQMERVCADSDMLYLFPGSRERIREAATFARRTGKLTMAYRSEDLDEGVLMSVHLGRSVRPYLNLRAAKTAGIRFSSDLKRISKFWSAGGGR